MEKKISVLLILILSLLLLTACGDHASPSADSDSSIPFSNVIIVVETPKPVSSPAVGASDPAGSSSGNSSQGSAVPGSSSDSSGTGNTAAPSSPLPVRTPAPTALPVYTPAPTPVPTPIAAVRPQVTITKSPITETVPAGGTAVFTAYADNATSVNWLVASGDRQTIYTLADAPNHFPGLTVSGVTSNVITLSNIPALMNGWEVQAYFTGEGGPKYTADAYIYVSGTAKGPAESTVLKKVQECVQAVKTYSYLGYTVSDYDNYSYKYDNSAVLTDPNYCGTATFNVTFKNANYTIVAEFIASANGYYPVSAAAFDSSWSVQAYSFINNTTLKDFHDKVLCYYALK